MADDYADVIPQRSVTEDEVAVDADVVPEDDLPSLLKRQATLAADLEQAEQAVTALGEEVRSAFTRGDSSASTLVVERAAARERATALREAIEALAPVIAQAQKAERHDKGEARMLGIKRAIGSLHAAYAEDIERVQELSAALTAAIARVNERVGSIAGLRAEALVLTELLGLDPPDLPPQPQRPAADGRLVAAIDRVAKASLSDLPPVPPKLSSVPYRGTGWDVRRVLGVVAGTPTSELIEVVGAGLLGDAEGWERRRTTLANEVRDRMDARRVAEEQRYLDWVRQHLAEGPVALEAIKRSASEAGLRFTRDGNHHGQSVTEAADVLGVLGLEEQRGGPVFWGLPNTFDTARFRPLTTTRSMAGLR